MNPFILHCHLPDCCYSLVPYSNSSVRNVLIFLVFLTVYQNIMSMPISGEIPLWQRPGRMPDGDGRKPERQNLSLENSAINAIAIIADPTGAAVGIMTPDVSLADRKKKSPNRTVRGYHWLAQVKEYGSGSDRSGAPRHFASHETGTLCSIISKSPISPSHIKQVFFDQLITHADDHGFSAVDSAET